MAGGSPQSFKAALTDNDSTAQELLGTIRYDENAVYKYVKYSGTNAVAIGDFCCYVVSDTSGQTVDKANSVLGAGVCMGTVASGSVSYGWIKVRGYATLNVALDAGSDGNAATNKDATAGTLRAIDATAEPQVAIIVGATAKIVNLMCPS